MENKYPILSVKNFGKIKEANIELAPFTLFVGDNNSGKSYILSLIWGILDIIRNISNNSKYLFELNEDIISQDIYNKCVSILKNINDSHNNRYDFTKEDIINFVELSNLFLNKNKSKLLNYIFGLNSNRISIEKLELKFPYFCNINLEKEMVNMENNIATSFRIINNRIYGNFVMNNNENIENKIPILTQMIIVMLFDEFNLYNQKNVFLPTSRTGFILSYKKLAADNLEDDIELRDNDNQYNNNYFTRPIVQFIKELLLMDKIDYGEEINKLLKYIESEIIYGEISLDKVTKNIYYKSFNMESEFSMNISSAVITEISPLYLFLKYGIINKTLFIEEPEISLHPELQQKIGKIMIRMVNNNKSLFITTHSDTIVQHINNMISLDNNSEENKKYLFNKYNYGKLDTISKDKIRMYQFNVNKDSQETNIEKLECNQYGFTLPTFNDILKKIHGEIIDFHANI